MRERLSKVITKIWGAATFILLFAGGLTSVGYLLAFIIGGSTGEAIAVFLHKELFPVIIFSTSVLIVLGWIQMELKGEWALTGGKEKKKKQSKK